MLTIIFTQDKLGYLKGQKVSLPNPLAKDLIEHNEAVLVDEDNLVKIESLPSARTRAFNKKPNA